MTGGTTTFPLADEQLVGFCERHHIRRLRLFGSTARGEAGPGSDVDVLVEFEPGHLPGWDIVAIEDELSGLLGGRPVDLVNPKYLNPRIKDRVLSEARTIYERG